MILRWVRNVAYTYEFGNELDSVMSNIFIVSMDG